MLKRSYFLTLGCSTNADEAGLRHAFRKLAKHYHPDRVGPNALAFFTDVVEAYRALRNLDQRSAYTKGLDDAHQSGNRAVVVLQSAETPLTQDVPAVAHLLNLTEGAKLSGNLLWEAVAERVRHAFLAGQSLQRNEPQGIDLQVLVSADDALKGGIVVIDVPTFYPCATCHASGRYDDEPCLECEEHGVINERELVRVVLPRLLADYTRVEIPICGLGIHNFYLRVCFRIAGNLTRPAPGDASMQV